MKYVILIYSNPESRRLWQSFSDAERAAGFQMYAELTADLVASGEQVVNEALADPSTATRVSMRDGRTMTSDGPFAEVKEHLAGFYLVDCDSMERAVEIAARIPEASADIPGAPRGLIEVRPVLDLSA